MPSPSLQAFAFHGLPLLLPHDWNLTRFQGSATQGSLLFADLRAPRLAVRWKPPARFSRQSPADHLARLRTTLKPHLLHDTPDLLLLHKDNRPLALLADARRLIELECPAPSAPDLLLPLAQHLAASLRALHLQPSWLWQLYGILGHAPAWAKLTHASLLPGQSRITLTHRHARITLGSQSLADHALANRSLKTWAIHTLALPATQAHWTELPTAATYQSPPRRVLFRRGVIHAEILHFAPENRIRWTHTSQPATNP